jgi:leucyl/phenylalanyl-tRNA--protein transferase
VPIEPPPTPWQFPLPPDEADDVIALGADLEPGTVLSAYRGGLFPMHLGRDLAWWSPEQRGVLRVGAMRVTRSLRQSARHFEIRVDTAFDEVIEGCADPRRDGAWITAGIRDAYRELHDLGWVHSVEAWRGGELAGGLYGVAIGGLFAGESMFSRQRDASKVALLGLTRLLDDEYADQRLIDTQWRTDHLATLGVVEMPRASYIAGLQALLRVPLPAVFAS